MDIVDKTFSEFEHSQITHELFLENVLFVLSSLTEAEQQIIRLRTGLSDGKVKSRIYISRELQVSESTIRNAESAILQRIKNNLGCFVLPEIFQRQDITVLEVIKTIANMPITEEQEVLKRKLGLFDGKFWSDQSIEKELGCSSARSGILVQQLFSSLKKR